MRRLWLITNCSFVVVNAVDESEFEHACVSAFLLAACFLARGCDDDSLCTLCNTTDVTAGLSKQPKEPTQPAQPEATLTPLHNFDTISE